MNRMMRSVAVLIAVAWIADSARNNAGYRAVTVTPIRKDGHPRADVTLVKRAQCETAPEKLD